MAADDHLAMAVCPTFEYSSHIKTSLQVNNNNNKSLVHQSKAKVSSFPNWDSHLTIYRMTVYSTFSGVYYNSNVKKSHTHTSENILSVVEMPETPPNRNLGCSLIK